MRFPKIVGLTGGIACGKSLVAGLLAREGIPVIDADVLARRVLDRGRPELEEVVRAFGSHVLDEGGRLDRAALGKVVFGDPSARERLEAIVHPGIQRLLEEEISTEYRDAEVVVYDAALLVETGAWRHLDALLVVTCEPELQLARLMARDGIGREEALARIRAQAPQAEKVALADAVVDNSGSREDTRRSLERAWHRIMVKLGIGGR